MSRVFLCTPPWSYAGLAAAGGVRRARPGGRLARDVSGQGVLPTLGLHFLAATLEGHGHLVDVVEGHGATLDAMLARIAAARPDVVGVSVQTPLWGAARDLLEAVRTRSPGVRTAVGGAHATLRGARLLADCAALDAVFVGPAEDTFRRWVDAPDDRDRRVIHATGVPAHPRGWASRLALRVPWRGCLPNLLFVDHPRFATSVTSVGCAQRCAFCAVSGGPERGAGRPNAELLEELTSLARVRRRRSVNFMDDDPVFVRPGDAGPALLRDLADRRLGLSWTIYLGRFDVDEERLRLMKRAGCRRVLLMAESGTPRVLSYVKGRAVTPDEVAAAAERVHRAGLEACARFQFGFPGETWEDGRETLRFARSLPLTLASFLPAMLYPGSRMARDYAAMGRLTDDEARWSYYGRPYEPDGMTTDEQEALVRRGVLSFYGRPAGLRGLARVGRAATIARRVLVDGAT